jgi:ABC-type nitrate/sulfonate/bicarbonate transport system ATPase subunit
MKECVLIEMKAISKKFQEHKVLNKFNLRVISGEILAIMGASGIGKTTLLRIMAQLEPPDEGEIRYDASVFEGIEIPFPFVFQDSTTLVPWCTVTENIKLVKPKISEDELNHFLEAVALEDHCDKPLSELSGGMKQRVGLARALVCSSKLIFMDEPFASLDSPLKQNLYQMIRTLQQKYDLTIIFVTHDDKEAEALATRVIRL